MIYRLVISCCVGAAALMASGTSFIRHSSAAEPVADPAAACEPQLGGAGGVYFLAAPGKLTVDVCKRDRNRRGSRAELRAILVGPDRRVIQEVRIPDDEQPRGSGLGPLQQARLTADVDRPGVYVLNITVATDRYGDEAVWGFETNCPRYVIETSRGHRDERHQEPIVLARGDAPGDVLFAPRRGPFSVEVSGLPDSAEAVEMYDQRDQLVQRIPVDERGQAAQTFDGGQAAGPWRLHLPAQQATIHIDGLTRWDENDAHPDLCYWTTRRSAWFPLADYRWLLTPYSRLVYSAAGETGETAFRVQNDSSRRTGVRLSIEFPAAAWPVDLSTDRVLIGDGQSAELRVRYTAGKDGEVRICHLRAVPESDPELTTYSTLEVRTGDAPASAVLPMPIVLRPYQHENQQFGYLPEYPLENQMYFDLQNRPFTVSGAGIATLQEGGWKENAPVAAGAAESDEAAGRAYRLASTKLAFGPDNTLYALGAAGGETALLYSGDGGKSFAACTIPARRERSASYDLEIFSGHNPLGGPPPVLRYTRTASDPKLFWRRLHDLELFLPSKVEGRLVMGQPVLISRKSIGLSAHSGIAATVVSRGQRVHVVWGEATEPEEKAPGVPTFVATYDRSSGRLSEPALVGYGAPPNDIHNTPSITIDSRGHLHALAGTHGRPFQYARSLQPNSAAGGWTPAQPVGENLPQTYIGLVCGSDDRLHLAYRLWRSGEEPHPASQHAVLAYQNKRPGENWDPPQPLVVPPFSEYSVYYHRLTIDRRGRLFLSYDHWSTFWFYRLDRGVRRSLLMSPDGGQSWKLVETADLAGG